MSAHKHVFVTVIARPPSDVWKALTSPEFTKQYWHSTRVQCDFQTGSRIEFLHADGSVGLEGKILTVQRPVELSYTWRFPNIPDAKDESDSRVIFKLEEIPQGTKLTVVHDQFPDNSVVEAIVEEGWPLVLGGLKTLLETGTAVDFSAAS